MRVAVDATALLGHRTGVGVVAAELVAGLARRDDVDLTAFALTWRGRGGLAGQLPPGVRPVTRPMAARPLREAWRRADHPVIERWTGPVDVVHGPNFVVPPSRRAARVLTIHDLTFVHHPELCTADTLGYPPLIRRALAGGAWVHAVSAFVAEEVIEVFGASPERVVAVPNGGPDPSAPAGDAAAGRRLAGHDRYLLAIGTIEPRKDLPSLVAAFGELTGGAPADAGLDDAGLGDAGLGDVGLVVAGPDGWGTDAFEAAVARLPVAARGRLRRLGWVTDEQRADLLAGAAALVYPSRYEGFGLVPLEAMAAETPVVTTTAGALPETVGDAALLVPVGDVDALAGALHTVLTDAARADDLRRRGAERLARFSWDDMVDGVVALYGRAGADRS